VHYYPHHIGDFIKATARLTDAQTMAYLRLIWMYYDRERPLPDDIQSLAFQLGTDESTVKLILVSYFRLQNAAWSHSRCDAEIEAYKANQEKKSRAGKASAERRKSISSTDDEQVFNSSSTSVQLTKNQEPITNNHKPIEKNKRASAPVVAKPDEVTDQTWTDFLAHRKLKRATVSDTVLDSIRREAQKAGWSLDAALRECVARNWQGFKAEWVKQKVEASKDDLWDYAIGRKTTEIDHATILRAID
jgi:uncharacterized protein YdaU (DUF1376 family)